MTNSFHVAVDGPSGVGKSTVAKALAQRLGSVYVDTGAMYRAIGLKALREGIALRGEEALRDMLGRTELSFTRIGGAQRVLLDGEDEEEAIRTPEATRASAEVSQVPAVRMALKEIQRGIARKQPVVMDGRDIGTNVLPDAKYKFFLTASADVRAERRFAELTAKGKDIPFDEVMADMRARDLADESRAIAPLKPAPDAITIDTDDLDIKGVLEAMLRAMGEDA